MSHFFCSIRSGSRKIIIIYYAIVLYDPKYARSPIGTRSAVPKGNGLHHQVP